MTDHPLLPGARVYHWRAQQYPEALHGTATVIRAEAQSGGGWEYLVDRDKPLFEGGDTESWWSGYYTAKAMDIDA